MVQFRRVQHVSVPAPMGSHPATRAFYGGLLGLPEKAVHVESLGFARAGWCC